MFQKQKFLFKPKRKPPYFNMKIKLNRKRLYRTDSVRYLGVKIAKLPSIFSDWFTFSSISYNYQTSFASKGNLEIPSV